MDDSSSLSSPSPSSVKLLGYWASPYSLRVKWGLKMKGIEYEYLEEDLRNKSPLLLQANPIYKKIPVLIHGGRALSESLLILEYIDETWTQNPLFPDHPFHRAQARFWAKFVDEKCVPAVEKVFRCKKGSEEQEEAAKEAREKLKILESGLEGKKLFGFGGEKIGFVDIAAGWLGLWIRMSEEITGANMIDLKEMNQLNDWFDKFLENPIIKECLPHRPTLLQHMATFHNALLLAAPSAST